MKRNNSQFKSLIGFLLWFFLSHSIVFAQTDDFVITRFTDDAGLPQNSIKGIATDNLGFIWLVTESGVVRYDGGGHFKLTDSMNNTLSSQRMYSFHYDGESTDILWAQTSTEQMVYIHNGKAIAQNKNFWEITRNSYRADKTFYSRGLPNRYPDLDSLNLILGEVNGKHFLLRRDTISYYLPDAQEALVSIPYKVDSKWDFFYNDNKLYEVKGLKQINVIESNGKVHSARFIGDLLNEPLNANFQIYYNGGTNEAFIYCNENFYLIQATAAGDLYTTRILHDFSFENNRITVAHYNVHTKQLFLGSDSKGLFIIQPKKFKAVRAMGKSPNDIYYLQTILSDSSILTDRGKAFSMEGEARFKPLIATLKKHYAQLQGPDGNLWVLTPDSLLFFTANGNQLIKRMPNPEKSQCLYRAKTDDIWLGSIDGTLYKWNKSNTSFQAKAETKFQISWIEQAANDCLWIGTYNGLFLYLASKSTITPVKGLVNSHIRSLYCDKENRLWITTYQQGVYLLDDGKLTHFPLDKNKHIANAHCLMEDDNNYLWISTNKGLFQVSKKQLLNYKGKSNQVIDYFYYNKDNGFTTNEFNGGCQPCAIELTNGYFSFPSLDGLVWFDPLTIQPSFPKGPIIIDEINLDGLSINPTNNISLPKHFSRLNLTIATPYYGDRKNLNLEYVIDKDSDQVHQWLPFNTADNTISINSLASGLHKIQIRMRSGLKKDDYIYGSLNVYVQPYFYETWWFMSLSVLVLVGLGWLILRLKTAFVVQQNQLLTLKVAERSYELRKQNELQKRLSATITHDVKAPLNYVVLALQGIYRICKIEHEKIADEVNNLYEVTKQISQYCSNISQFYKATFTDRELEFHKANIYDIINEQIKIFKHIASQRKTSIINEVPADLSIYTHTDILAIILHNLLDNAIKYTKNGTIYISADLSENDFIYLKIKDNGVGIDAKELQYLNDKESMEPVTEGQHPNDGLGIILVKDWIRILKGEIHIDSNVNEGTTVTLRFSADTMHFKSIQ
jgi:signal transduction histidine kinase